MTAMDLDWGVILTQLGGGLALFLYGMRRMTESLKTVAGSGMKNLLARLTTNRFTAAFAGTVITAVIQSSSVTTVLIVGFISAGLLTLGQSIGVILGANVGTTVTAQIIAFQVYKYGLLMIATGFFTEILARRERVRQWGTALMGLGLIFFGMELMSIATGPVREWPPFIELMQNMQNPLLSVAIGALLHGDRAEFLGNNRHRHRAGKSGLDFARVGHRPYFRCQHRYLRYSDNLLDGSPARSAAGSVGTCHF